MVYKIYSNRIALLDDEGLALAEIDFPAVEGRPGIVKITHTLVDESLRGRGIAGKLMAKLCSVLEKKELRAVPYCGYAESWFEKHPEASWLLAEEAARRNTVEKMSSSESAGEKYSVLAESEMNVYRDEAGEGRRTSRVCRTENEADEEEGTLEQCMTAASRILQLFSGFLMAMLMIVFGYAALLNLSVLGNAGNMITEQNPGEIAYTAISGGLLLYMFLNFIWILTRRRYARRDALYSVDRGRGMTAFLVIFVLAILAGTAESMLSGVDGAWEGAALAAKTLEEQGQLLRQLAFVGLVCCVIRKHFRK